ncbi:hypothetical protein NEOC65_000810 [Neochlamydia sp. AcF65]|nr:hypothetical protein [Neochlamydia sp. AcF65]MBS4171126.1 hypothetical protein [Neochlamydia sp. AcF95]
MHAPPFESCYFTTKSLFIKQAIASGANPQTINNAKD